MATATLEPQKLTRKDFVSDQEVRWCPGCGDYAILAQMQKILPEIGVPCENVVFISGIGCSSRFPYYMNTYGIHSIHGRAPTLATGLKVANPDLSVWVITGDGDGLSIGANHLLHACRRNADINIILFNNRIYGLTKGQYSPTSLPGTRTKSSPQGSIEQAFNPISVAISAESTFVARSVDVHTRHLQEILRAAAAHRGTSFVEIYQNCLIFNDGTWDHVTKAKVKADNILPLEHGAPMVFGKDMDRGLRMNGTVPEVVQLEDDVPESELLTHDAAADDPHLAFLLSRLGPPHFPTPLGVFRQVDKPVYNAGILSQIDEAVSKHGEGDLKKLYYAADTWSVAADDSSPDAHLEGDVSMSLDEEYLDEIDQDAAVPGEIEVSFGDSELLSLKPPVPVTVTPDTNLAEVIEMMRSRNIGSVLVVNAKNNLIGVFTERDILNRVVCNVEDLASINVAAVMTRNPTVLPADTSIAHALHLMAIYGFRHLPIVDSSNHPQGIVSFRDVVGFIGQYFESM